MNFLQKFDNPKNIRFDMFKKVVENGFKIITESDNQILFSKTL